jgi:lipopolysaccharide/colanic/teichoic acid biosynthesis glycosyltransferase
VKFQHGCARRDEGLEGGAIAEVASEVRVIPTTNARAARGAVHETRDISPDTWEERVRLVAGVAVSAVALVILSPLMIAIALLIKLDSPGPVLFRQKRIGRRRRKASPVQYTGAERRRRDLYGRPFTFYKFRTMFADAEKRFPHLYDYSHGKEELRSLPIKMLMAKRADARLDRGVRSWPKQALQENDPRVTRVGRWLRRTSLDELPNLFNVLLGDIHLVGPRPDIAENIRHYEAHELRILDVKPGVTGLAQVEGRGLLSFEEINRLDLEYLEARSLWMDARIVVRTFAELIKGRGAY